MLEIGIIWNTVQEYKDEIIDDIKCRVNYFYSFDLNLQDKYVEFVNDIYKSENMQQWKIDKKIFYMQITSNRTVTVILFRFDDRNMEYNKFKNKYVYTQLENLKCYIREKYKNYIDNYIFDIVFHATDNLDELIKCYSIIFKYVELDVNNYKNINILKRIRKIVNKNGEINI